jgi:large subunit ribosomal protein L2
MGKRVGSRRRGAGSATYRSPSHRHSGNIVYPRQMGEAKVVDIQHAPGRTAPIMLLKFTEAKGRTKLIAPEGIQVGQKICLGSGNVERGAVLPLSQIPEGTLIHNIEITPTDGGKLVRAAGTSATIVSHGEKAVVQLPSGHFKALNPACLATVGVVAGGGRGEKPFAKAGKKFHAFRSTSKAYLRVRGVAMAPVNHPHGGGSHQHVGRPSTVGSDAWPGQKVGRFSPQRKKKGKR